MDQREDLRAADGRAAPSRAAAILVREAVRSDAEAIARIHNQGIEERSATFETEPRSVPQVTARISDRRHLTLVAERDGHVVGWAGVSRPTDRCSQAGVGEYTIYVDRELRGQRIGGPLLEALVAAAEQRGFWKLYGRIFTSNAASVSLAKGCGFSDVGVHRRHGRLDGEWKDVLLVEKLIGEAARS